MGAKEFIIKSRARFSKKKQKNGYKNKITKNNLEKLQNMENQLENVEDKIQTEIEEIEKVKEIEKSSGKYPKEKFGWIKGGMTKIALQDFVGASMGAVFFGLTQEVWDQAAKLTSLNLIFIILVSLLISFLVIYLSRRRKTISEHVYHTTFFRGLEIYTVSLVTAFFFVLILGIGYNSSSTINLTVLISLAATISAGTADLLFS